MGKEPSETRSKIPQSHIPIIAPRPSLSTLPTSLSTPYLGLVPPTRHPAVSGSPTHPTTGPNSSASGGSGGLASLRSFRNLLSFGPPKHNAAHPHANTRRAHGGMRRSSQLDHSPTAPPPSAAKSQEDLPVLSIEMSHTIELSHQVNEPLIDPNELQARLGLQAHTPETVSPASSVASVNTLDAPITPSPLGVSELSTILEADNSSLSQSIRFDLSRDDHDALLADNGRTLKTVASGPLLRPQLRESHQDNRPSCDASPLDLSTNTASSEVLAALAGSDRNEGWLYAVVVEDAPGARAARTPSPNPSFDLGVVDPERIGDPQPSPTMSIDKQSRHSPSASSYARQLDVPSYPLSTPNSPTRPSASPAHSTPSRHSSSIARPTISRAGSSFVPRLSRSASERPSSRAGPSPLLPSPTIPSPTAQRSPTSYGRSSLQLRRVSPASETLATRRSTAASRDIDAPRTNAASRLILPSRHRSGSASGRPHVRSLEPASPSWDVGDSVSARSGSAGSPASAELRSNMPRPSLDGGGVRSSSRIGGRERSSSLGESTQYHPTRLRPADWLGPRTAKAFAAAGLLDPEKDGVAPSVSRPGSRFSSTRSERDMRSQYAPSRMAFSETGSRSSWSRRSGSISRTAASSDVLSSHGGPLSSESASAPRTVFSSSSTAPTSLSAASSAQKHLQTELQLLQDRHSLETGALLNALADSQRTTRLLRDENVQLRDQMQRLEDRLADALEELRRLQLPPPPKPLRNNFYRLASANANTVADDTRRILPRSRLQTVFPPEPEPVCEADFDLQDPPNRNHSYEPAATYDSMPMPSDSLQPHTTDSYSDTISKRRHSGSSSIFPVLPSNMSMLLHDEGGPERRQARSLSPSPAISHSPLPGGTTPKTDQEIFDYHQRTISMGNISPTTATFSMITNSPRSLCLRPEHERLLGDMPTLDLCAEDYEHDEYDDDRHGS